MSFFYVPDDEQSIIWLEPPERHRYVRVYTSEYCHFRSRRPQFGLAGRMVGYSTLSMNAQSRGGHFARRIFWLAPHDPYDGGGMPCEGFDPMTINPGIEGEKTERANGGPFRDSTTKPLA